MRRFTKRHRATMTTGPNQRGGALLTVALALATTAIADQERSNTPHVRAGQYGHCYVRAVPEEPYGSAGETTIYLVEREGDKKLYSFDWFAQRVFIECRVTNGEARTAPAVVRLGPWPRGHRATEQDLAIAFYWGDRLVKRYSTLDLAGEPDNVISSVSHYTVVLCRSKASREGKTTNTPSWSARSTTASWSSTWRREISWSQSIRPESRMETELVDRETTTWAWKSAHHRSAAVRSCWVTLWE